jgi:hypothetical protein
LLALTACDAARVEPTQHLPAPPGAPKFTLLVSNQSFELDQVDIRVEIDDQLAVTGDFLVEGQHTWLPFELDLSPGTHLVRATSADASATLDQTFTMEDRAWGVLTFWYSAGSEPTPPSFAWTLHDEQPAFD